MSSMKYEVILVVTLLIVVGSIPQLRDFAISLLMVMAMIAMIVVSLPAALCMGLVRRPAPTNPPPDTGQTHYRRSHQPEVTSASDPTEELHDEK